MSTDYDAIRAKILALITKAGVTLTIEPTLETRNRSAGDDSALSFAFVLAMEGGFLPHRGTYSAGVGIADSWAKSLPRLNAYEKRVLANPREHRTVDGAEVLRALRARYRPCIVDVVSALVHDAGYAQDFDSWEDMAEDAGMELKTADDLRRAQKTYLACKESRAFLVRAFRGDYDALTELCREL